MTRALRMATLTPKQREIVDQYGADNPWVLKHVFGKTDAEIREANAPAIVERNGHRYEARFDELGRLKLVAMK